MTDTFTPGLLPSAGEVEDWVRGHTLPDLPSVEPTPLAAFKWLTDEVAMQIELATGRTRIPDGSFRRRLRSELTEARELFEEQGWLADPLSYHRDPSGPIQPSDINPATAASFEFEHVRFPSTYEPWPDEPGSERWNDYRPVQTGHAWMMRHDGEPRPWMVLVNGYRTGDPALDLGSFRANHLHHRLGLNVITVVLPLHGPRSIGASGSRVIHAGAMNTVFTLSQGAYDVRSVIRWLRDEYQAPAIGMTGISLGGYMVSLLSGLEDDLACVIAGVPESDLVRGIRRQMEPLMPPFYEQWGLSWEPLRQVLSVASPLSFECRVPRDHRYIYAGLLDRWVRPGNVHTLWQHWGESSIHWYQGSHLSFPFEPSVAHYVDQALNESFDL
ncbi:MAG: alpha/beta hydrolase [Actinomycetia bacterium]|nr:alpha/beta hydrolase [Actinomycetes bacterium]MCP4087135.1 alpha/beta hydrolase [Actinomycetes bacterium]